MSPTVVTIVMVLLAGLLVALGVAIILAAPHPPVRAVGILVLTIGVAYLTAATPLGVWLVENVTPDVNAFLTPAGDTTAGTRPR